MTARHHPPFTNHPFTMTPRVLIRTQERVRVILRGQRPSD